MLWGLFTGIQSKAYYGLNITGKNNDIVNAIIG